MEDRLAAEMYREHILDHYKHPHNFGKLKNATHVHNENNPLCGDEITIQIIVKNNKVVDVKFIGKGCAISIASASLLTDMIKGMPVKDIMSLKREGILDMLKIPISVVRLKCALISLETVHKALGGHNGNT